MIAFDTNVLFYCCDNAEPQLRAIARGLIRQTRQAVLPWQVAVEFVGSTRRLERRGFTRQLAWSWLSYFTRMYPLVLPNQRLLAVAQGLHVEQQWGYWDALIVAACLDAGGDAALLRGLAGAHPAGGPGDRQPLCRLESIDGRAGFTRRRISREHNT